MAHRVREDGSLTAMDKPSPAEEVAGREQLPRDRHGYPLKGAAREAYQQRASEVQAAIEARELMESLAAAVMVLASRITGLPGPDAVRALMTGATGTDGAGHGLAVVRAARGSVPAQQAAWQAEAPVKRQASATVGGGWEADPDHDPRVMEAIRCGASTDQLNRIRHFVAAERNAGRAEQAKQSGVLWTLRSGEPLMDGTGQQAAPVQRSVVQRNWEDFPDHQPSGAPPQQAASQETAAPQGQQSVWADTHGGQR